jgi:hypothetical protein
MALPFHVEQPIDAPPDVVFRFITRVENTLRWMDGTTAVEALTDGPIAVGSRYRQTRAIGGRTATVELVVRELDAGSGTLALEADGRRSALGRGVFRFRYAVRPAERRAGASQVVLDGEIDALGRAVELVASFFVAKFVKVLARDLEALRRCVEQAPGRADGGPAAGGEPDRVTTSSTSRAPST